MTTTHDPALCARLIAEAREDDACLPSPEWRNTFDMQRADVVATLLSGEVIIVARVNITSDDATDREHAIAASIARTRNNLRALADQLEAAGRDLQHAVSENFAFNVKVATEISELRRELQAVTTDRDALRAEVERLNADKRRAQLSAEGRATYERLRWTGKSDEARLELMALCCHHCGTTNLPCYCGPGFDE